MILAFFAFRVRPQTADEFHDLVGRMAALVHEIPGFIAMDLFRSDDGRTLAVPRFETLEALEMWRDHPEHVLAQEQGRERFFDDYWIDVCSTVRSYEFHREDVEPTHNERLQPWHS
jgi:heme-degrading monooxygenase HmoA